MNMERGLNLNNKQIKVSTTCCVLAHRRSSLLLLDSKKSLSKKMSGFVKTTKISSCGVKIRRNWYSKTEKIHSILSGYG